MSNAELIERVRCYEQDHSPDGWPAIRMREVSALADALAAADKRIAELEQVNCSRLDEAERKLAIAVYVLKTVVLMPRSHEAHRRAVQALAQIGGDDARS